MNQEDQYSASRKYFDLSNSFFQLVENFAEEIILRRSPKVLVSKPINDEKAQKAAYKEHIKWHNTTIIIPILFNFFHALELSLKALLLLNESGRELLNNKGHKLSILLNDFKKHYPSEEILFQLFNRYVNPYPTDNPILHDFFTKNDVKNADGFYQILRYPFDINNEKKYNHIPLLWPAFNSVESKLSRKEFVISFFEKLRKDIAAIDAEIDGLIDRMEK